MRRRLSLDLFDRTKRAAIFAALFFCACSAWAEDVRLTSREGGMTLSGRLLDFDGTYLTIASQHGPVSVIYENVSCEGEDCPIEGAFVPRVRTSAVPEIAEILLPALIQRFATVEGLRARTVAGDDGHLIISLEDAQSTLVRFDIRPATADESFADLIAFEADFVLSRREITATEMDMADEARVAEFASVGESFVVGYDALIPIVSPNRRVDALSPADLLAVVDGRVTDWGDLGSEPGPIRLQLSSDQPGMLANAADGAVTHPDFETVVAAVVSDRNAMGIVSFQKTGFAQQIDLVDACGLVALPTQLAIKTGDYPLTVPLYLFRAERALPDRVQEFLDWLSAPQAQLVVRRSGFVDAALLPIPLDAQGQRFVHALQVADTADALGELRDLAESLKGLTRLSMSFRFEPGSTELDAVSRARLLRLVQAIEAGGFAGRKLQFFGFSDGQGNALRNRALSRQRAVTVRQILLDTLSQGAAGTVQIETAGFGEALPVGCDDTALGRQLNRRVELWVGD